MLKVKDDKIYAFHEGMERIMYLQKKKKAFDFIFTFMIDCTDVTLRMHDISEETERSILETFKEGTNYNGKFLKWNGIEPNLYNLVFSIKDI